jgi:hypothetical protein
MDKCGPVAEKGTPVCASTPMAIPRAASLTALRTDNGTRGQECLTTIRDRQCDTDLPLPTKPGPSLLVTTITSATQPTIPPQRHHISSVPPDIFLSSIWLGRLHHKDMGLGVGRARTDDQGPHQSCPRRRFWRTSRRHTAGILQFRPDDQIMGPSRRV